MAAAPQPLKKVRKGYFSLEDLLLGRRSMEPANISGAMTAKIAGASLAGRHGWSCSLADHEDKERRRLACVWV